MLILNGKPLFTEEPPPRRWTCGHSWLFMVLASAALWAGLVLLLRAGL